MTHSIRHTLPRFLAVGVASTVVNYAAYWLLLGTGLRYEAAFIAGFLVGVAVGYTLNRHWTYAGQGGTGVFGRYLGVYAVSLVAGTAFLRWLVEAMGIDPRLANFHVIVLTTGVNYLGTRLWVFRK